MTEQVWTPLHARLHRTFRSRQLLPKGQRAIVAVSGGQDSLCLLRLMLDLQPKWSWHLAVAHCDHRWRSDSALNAAYVEELAQTWEVPYYQATAPDLSPTEAAAREWRYQALTEIALTQNYACVVTGHTQSDRAETLLYNLLRGSGTDGLQALTWTRELVPGIRLIRPLLEFSRSETAEFCLTADLKIWEDSTNQDWRYARNRIRQELIPYLQTHFNPQVEQALAQAGEVLRADLAYLEAVTDQWWQQVVRQESKEELTHEADSPCWQVNRSQLKQAPLAIQRRLLRRVLLQVLPTAPNFEQIEKLVHLLAAPNRSQTDPFPGGAIAQVTGDWIVLKQK
ncbi:MAG TPA: tRNA lysidine(34) synthetase TilS [Allocoleopsis sp.]